eukprot:scaffold224712_cov43-Prasinocladus_malaysianus.AAC.1
MSVLSAKTDRQEFVGRLHKCCPSDFCQYLCILIITAANVWLLLPQEYIPELDFLGVERASAPCGRLCHWVRAMERHLYAQLRLDQARERFRLFSGLPSVSKESQRLLSPTTNSAIPVVLSSSEPTAESEADAEIIDEVLEGVLDMVSKLAEANVYERGSEAEYATSNIEDLQGVSSDSTWSDDASDADQVMIASASEMSLDAQNDPQTRQ